MMEQKCSGCNVALGVIAEAGCFWQLLVGGFDQRKSEFRLAHWKMT